MKWIFFDLGSTLVDESDVYTSRCEFAIRQLNIFPAEFMNKVYEEAKISPTPIRAAAKAYGVVLPEWDNSLEKLYEATRSVLSGLHGKYKLGIIANQSLGTQDRIDNWDIGQYFDVVMASAEAGCAKPDLKIFTMALNKAKCEPTEAVMVGDRLDNDIIPAKKLGMKTVWVRQGYARYQSIDDESKRPDYIVDSIDELTGLFESNSSAIAAIRCESVD
ncbi:MAG: HAD family hydrolase [Lachnospiraceae bacterium]|nr:HAD family hydrolase [Lachnospiraceae bacterium]